MYVCMYVCPRRSGNSIGGVVEVVARNVPSGLGAPVFDTLEAELAKACMSLPASKGFEVSVSLSLWGICIIAAQAAAVANHCYYANSNGGNPNPNRNSNSFQELSPGFSGLGQSNKSLNGDGRPSIGTITEQWEFMRINFVNNSDEVLLILQLHSSNKG